MYLSERMSLAEFAYSDGNGMLLLRGNCAASYKGEMHYPKVAISGDGVILGGHCTCKARADSRCTHIATLLYLAEDLSLGMPPKVPGKSLFLDRYYAKTFHNSANFPSLCRTTFNCSKGTERKVPVCPTENLFLVINFNSF